MRQRIDLEELWSDAVQRADAADEGTLARVPSLCPFGLDDLLATDAAVSLIVARIGA